MSRGFPSMTALLGLLAVADFQNRNKIAEMLRGAGWNNPGTPHRSDHRGTLGDLLGNLGGSLGAPGQGDQQAGLGELVESFKQHGQADVAEYWVGMGPNKQIAPDQLEQIISPGVMATLT